MTPKEELNKILRRISQFEGERKVLNEQLASEKIKLDTNVQSAEYLVQARAVVQDVAKSTLSKLELHIASIVSLALSSVFPDPYEFVLEFVERRNQTEAMLWFKRGEELLKPEDASGCGPMDVASFALRIAFISLANQRRVVILDEPFKYVSVDLQEACSEMLKMISEKLGIQIIMISHLPRIIESADTVFEVDEGMVKVKEQTIKVINEKENTTRDVAAV